MEHKELLEKVKKCTLCAADFPHGANPVVRVNPESKLLIIGQAPGIKVHQSNIPWNDKSGDRLRDWLNLSKEEFYDERQISIMPMGFCYPGVDKYGGDKPPRKECAPLWHNTLRAFMPNIKLTLLVGSYAHNYYLKNQKKNSLSETVYHFHEYLPAYIPLPHPSWRNTAWLKQNPWFAKDLLPELREITKKILKD